MSKCFITGIGHALPSQVITNADWEKTLDTSDEWIVTRTGIRQRHFVGPDEYTTDLAVTAAREALACDPKAMSSLRYLILATSTPDHAFPAAASRVHQALGLSSLVAAFDLNTACSGFVFALHTAQALLRTEPLKSTALVIAAETMSRLLDKKDRNTAVLFGDGAGAVVLTHGAAADPGGILTSNICTEGTHYDAMYVRPQGQGIHMMGKEVFKHAVTRMAEELQTLKSQHPDIKAIIPHQANRRILEAVARQCDLPFSSMIYTGDIHGNTGSASIPLALHHAWRQGTVQKGDKVVFIAFAAGFSWGFNLVTL